jgi:hypothetical protein
MNRTVSYKTGTILASAVTAGFLRAFLIGVKGQVSEQWYKDGSNIILIKVTSDTVDQ